MNSIFFSNGFDKCFLTHCLLKFEKGSSYSSFTANYPKQILLEFKLGKCIRVNVKFSKASKAVTTKSEIDATRSSITKGDGNRVFT